VAQEPVAHRTLSLLRIAWAYTRITHTSRMLTWEGALAPADKAATPEDLPPSSCSHCEQSDLKDCIGTPRCQGSWVDRSRTG
jgi:hypothetical protein